MQILDLVGIFAFAVSGALTAIRRGYDLVGIVLSAGSPTDEALIEELGDVLYQVEFHATIAEQQGRFSIATETGELRRAELTGPFFTAEDDATYTLELSDFGADVEITAPPTG